MDSVPISTKSLTGWVGSTSESCSSERVKFPENSESKSSCDPGSDASSSELSKEGSRGGVVESVLGVWVAYRLTKKITAIGILPLLRHAAVTLSLSECYQKACDDWSIK